MDAKQFLDSCLTAKFDEDLSVEGQNLDHYLAQSRFEEMFCRYTGCAWSKHLNIAELTDEMTWKFRERADVWGVSHLETLQAYELCYEFIALMACRECCEGHVNWMAIEGLDDTPDADAK